MPWRISRTAGSAAPPSCTTKRLARNGPSSLVRPRWQANVEFMSTGVLIAYATKNGQQVAEAIAAVMRRRGSQVTLRPARVARDSVAGFAMGPRRDTEDAWQRSRAQLDKALARYSWPHAHPRRACGEGVRAVTISAAGEYPKSLDATVPRFPGRYLSVTTYRRNGTPVATPVWFVELDGRLLVETDANSGKVKRIRHNPSLRIAVCSASGRLRGTPVPATAELLPEAAIGQAEQLIKRKYRADMVVIGPLRFLQSALHVGRPRTRPVILAITPR